MKSLIVSLAVAAVLVLALPAGAQQFIQLPDGTWANDITPDGNIVVGGSPTGGFIWRWREEPTPTFIVGANDVTAVSDDGSVLVGCIDDPGGTGEVAARWTETTGWQSLGWLPNAQSCPSRSNAYDVSGDGSKVVGLSWAGCSGRAFIWDAQNGMQELLNLANGGNRASTISADGQVVAGFAQGNFSRTPAYWNAQDLSGSVLDPDFQGEVYGLNSNGDISVGTNYFSGSYLSAFIRTPGTGLVDLGTLNPGFAAAATDVSEDGSVITGFDYISLSREAWIWTEEEGLVGLDDFISSTLGLPPVSGLLVTRKVSDDGNVVVGGMTGTAGGFSTAGFILEIETSPAWSNLGGGAVGVNGIPQLAGSGTLAPGTPFSLSLTNAPTNATMLAWISLTSAPVEVFAGTVHAFPPNAEFVLPADNNGEFGAASTWPTGVPPATDMWFQFLVGDDTLPWGVTMSNALKATTP